MKQHGGPVRMRFVTHTPSDDCGSKLAVYCSSRIGFQGNHGVDHRPAVLNCTPHSPGQCFPAVACNGTGQTILASAASVTSVEHKAKAPGVHGPESTYQGLSVTDSHSFRRRGLLWHCEMPQSVLAVAVFSAGVLGSIARTRENIVVSSLGINQRPETAVLSNSTAFVGPTDDGWSRRFFERKTQNQQHPRCQKTTQRTPFRKRLKQPCHPPPPTTLPATHLFIAMSRSGSCCEIQNLTSWPHYVADTSHAQTGQGRSITTTHCISTKHQQTCQPNAKWIHPMLITADMGAHCAMCARCAQSLYKNIPKLDSTTWCPCL